MTQQQKKKEFSSVKTVIKFWKEIAAIVFIRKLILD